MLAHCPRFAETFKRWPNGDIQTATIVTIIQRWPNGALLAGYVNASRQVEAALLQESFPHSIVPDTEDDPVSQQTVLQAIAEIARFLKNFKCGNVGIDCFFAHLSTGIEFATFKCLVCLPQNVRAQFFFIISFTVSVSSGSQALYICRPSIPIVVMNNSALINSGERDPLWMSATIA